MSVNTNFVNSNNDLDFYERQILNQEFGLCPECNQPNTFDNWCKECYSKKFQQNFGNWTSRNEHIDKFIQNAQLDARNKYELLEWIPYNRLRNIKLLAQGGFSTVYRAIWLDGLIVKWDYEKQDWDVMFINLMKKIMKMQIILKLKILLKVMKNMVYL